MPNLTAAALRAELDQLHARDNDYVAKLHDETVRIRQAMTAAHVHGLDGQWESGYLKAIQRAAELFGHVIDLTA